MIEPDHRGLGKVLKEQSFLEWLGRFFCQLAAVLLAAWQWGLFPTKLGSQWHLLTRMTGRLPHGYFCYANQRTRFVA